MRAVTVACRILGGLLAATVSLIVVSTPAAAGIRDWGDAPSGGVGTTDAGFHGWAIAHMMRSGSWTRPSCTVTEAIGEVVDGELVIAEVIEHQGEVHWTPLNLPGWIGFVPGGVIHLDDVLQVIEDELEADYYNEECRADGLPALVRDVTLVPRPDPANLTEVALALLPIGAPPAVTNPSMGGTQLVNLETWLWLDPSYWRSHTRSASALGFETVVSAEPVRVEWDMGDGNKVVCGGPGTPYDTGRRAVDQSTGCGYTYPRAGEYTVTATAVWEGTGSIGGVPVEVGSVERFTQLRLDVTESQAIVVR